MTDAILDAHAHPEPHAPRAATAHEGGQQHPLRLYFTVWIWLFVLSTCSYMVDYFGLQGGLRWSLILIFMMLKAGLIVAIFMHMAWERLALAYAICLPMIAVLVFVAIMSSESGYTLLTREAFFALLTGYPQAAVTAGEAPPMLSGVVAVVLRTLFAVLSGAILALGFAFLIFLGDANGRGRPLLSGRLDRYAMVAVYLSWFVVWWWFGFSQLLLVVACAATAILCLVYVASYRATASMRP
jgi:cytochrome c oxidase subunit IV